LKVPRHAFHALLSCAVAFAGAAALAQTGAKPFEPGSRIVVNSFTISGWDADETDRVEGECVTWCIAYLYVVPARVAGTWRLPRGELTLDQNFQRVSGTLYSAGAALPVTNGRLHGDELSFTAGEATYTGRVNGDTIHGTNGAWSAMRTGSR
jgi:hypothetical protein